MLTIQQIITEADILVPNNVDISDKVIQLTGINRDFFNIVKIPKLFRFTGTKGIATVNCPTDVREKNIDLVNVGLLKYRSLDADNVNPLQNAFSFDDQSNTLTLTPAPYANGIAGVLRYHQIGTTTFTTGAVTTQTPDAPEEYQWTYYIALAAYLAETQDDGVRAANFSNQVKAAWNAASQNYQGRQN